MNRTFKASLFSGLIGLTLGWILSTWFAPDAISWYFDPPVDIGVNCKEATVWAMERFRFAQLVAMSAGAILSIVATIFIAKKLSKQTPPTV